jgi:hypothetical protein
MLGSSQFATEHAVATMWVTGCAIGGLVFIAIGARAGGLALLGAVVGAFIGFMVVSSDFDQLPQGAMVGATIGTFVGGLLGLAWTASASASAFALRALGSATILVGVLSVLAARAASQRLCRGRISCLPEADGGSLALFVLDAAWVAGLCFVQAVQSKPTDTTERDPVGGRDVADASR